MTGPLFDGRALAALRDYKDWAEREVAQQAMAEWHLNMDRAFQHPTSYYESTVHLSSDGDGAVVHDTGVIYNYWLEGLGSRNAPVTRFAGYHSAQGAADEAAAQVGRLVDPIPREFLARMGGGR